MLGLVVSGVDPHEGKKRRSARKGEADESEGPLLVSALCSQYMAAAKAGVFGVVRGGERPRPAFWLFSCLGAGLVAGFALSQGGPSSLTGDLLMTAAIVVCGLGYAEGATLSRRLGGWQVISWALVIALPLMGTLALATLPTEWGPIGMPAWVGLAYVSIFSMLVGFVFWYRGLALGGIAGVGQLQLLQPFFGLALAGLLLGEPIAPAMVIVTLLVVGCVAGAKRYG